MALPDYGAMLGDPFKAVTEGLQLGAYLQGLPLERSKRETALQQEDITRKQALLRFEAIKNLHNVQFPTANDFAAVATLLPKEEKEALMKVWSSLSDERQQQELKFGGQVLAALASNQPDIAVNLMKKRSDAAYNQGDQGAHRIWSDQAKIVENNPTMGLRTVGMMVAALPGSEKTVQNALSMYKAPEELRKAHAESVIKEIESTFTERKMLADIGLNEAQAKNLLSTINDRSRRFNLDRDKLQSDVEQKLMEMNINKTKLTPDALKIVNETVTNAVGSRNSADKLQDLANRFQAADAGGNIMTKPWEWAKKNMFGEGELTQLRNEFVRIKNSEAIKMLPPGQASDKDIAFALKGMPDINSDTQTITSFLRGMAKAQDLDSVVKNAQADWINNNGSLSRLRQDAEIGGTAVPRNTAFNDYIKMLIAKKMPEITAARGATTVQTTRQKSYMRYAGGQ